MIREPTTDGAQGRAQRDFVTANTEVALSPQILWRDSPASQDEERGVRTGLDRLMESSDLASKLRGERVGLLAHPASVTRGLVHASAVLFGLGVRPRIFFGPEHGLGGEAQDMIGVPDARSREGIPIRSLYGERFEALTPRSEDLENLDCLLIDLQDVGARFYTFVWTAVLAVRACQKAGVRVVVLDRPNPIGADPRLIEGRAQSGGFLSFVGLEPVPIRHGLTLGEIVAWRAHVEGVSKGLVEVVRVLGLEPAAHASAWDRPFVMPSPNMPSYDTALVYPGGCFVEGTNLSEGRGTTRPFEIVGAPWIDGSLLANDFQTLGLPGVLARPLTFLPMFHKHAGKVCGGVQVHVTDPLAFHPVRTYLSLLTLAHHQSAAAFRFRTERYEFVDNVPAFDLLTGSAAAREAIVAGAEARDVMALVADVSARDIEIVRDASEAAARVSV
jgi:uncharacterized protein YbbC (DUF1343 family)